MRGRRCQVYLDPKQHEVLRRLAFKRRVTMSALIRSAVADWVARATGKGKWKK